MSCFSAMNDEDMWKECDCDKNRPQFPRPPHQTDLLTIHAILQMSYSRFFNSKVARHEVWLDTELFSLVIVLKNSDNNIVKWFAIFDTLAWNLFFKKKKSWPNRVIQSTCSNVHEVEEIWLFWTNYLLREVEWNRKQKKGGGQNRITFFM